MFLGPRLAFALIGCIQALGALPLLGAPQVSVRNAAPLAFSAASLGMQLYVLNGWFAATFVLAWQVALFGALGESLSAYGGTMSLAALAGSLGGMLLGKGIDAGRGISAVSVVFVAIILVAALRATSLSWPEAAIAANALGAFAICFYVPVLMAPVYNLAKASPCALRFHVATESAWDVGCCTAALLAALVSGVGISLAWIVVLTIPATAGQLWLLRRHYQSLMGSGDSLLH